MGPLDTVPLESFRLVLTQILFVHGKGPQGYAWFAHDTICHCHMASLRSEQYLQFSGASGILSQHLARMWSGFVQTVGWWSDQCVLCKDYVWSVYDVTKLPNANKLFEQAKHMTMVCDMNGFECVKLSNTKGHLKARISNSHFKVRPNARMILHWCFCGDKKQRPKFECQHLPAPASVVPGQRTSTSLRSVSGGLGGLKNRWTGHICVAFGVFLPTYSRWNWLKLEVCWILLAHWFLRILRDANLVSFAACSEWRIFISNRNQWRKPSLSEKLFVKPNLGPIRSM